MVQSNIDDATWEVVPSIPDLYFDVQATDFQASDVIVNNFSPVNHGLFYRPGSTVTLELISTWNTTQVTFRTAAGGIVSAPAVPILGTGPISMEGSYYKHTVTFSWTSSVTENVGPDFAPRYDHYWVYADFGSPVQNTASSGLLFDDVVPSAANFSLPSVTNSRSVVLDWSGNKGADNSDDTFSPPNNNGIDEYVVYRNDSPIANISFGTFNFVDNNGGIGFDNGTVLSYTLRTYDQAGNYATSAAVGTTIALPIATPARFNAQWNRDIDSPTATENPVAAYGNTAIIWGAGAPYSGTITSFEILRSTSLASGYTTIATGIGATTYTYTINWASPASVADTYWYKVLSRSAFGTVESAPMAIVYDPQPAGQPLPATIAWSAGPIYAPTERRIPIDVTGSGRSIDPGWIADGNPLNTGSGVWRYLVYERETDNNASWSGMWTLVGMVDRDTMESDVWYHNYASLTNNRYYRYLVQSQDISSCFPSNTWPNGMVNSQFIEFQFSSVNLSENQLRVQSIRSNVNSAGPYEYFTISITIANVGTVATTPTVLNRFVTYRNIDATSCFSGAGPSPALSSIASGTTRTFEYIYQAHNPSTQPNVLGEVLFSAQVTWAGGSHTFGGTPAAVTITDEPYCNHHPVEINGISISGPRGTGPYFGGEMFNIIITYTNIGSFPATNIDGSLWFSNHNLETSNPLPINLTSGSMGTQTFSITVFNSATTGPVTITATWTSDGFGFGDIPADNITVYIQNYYNSGVEITGMSVSGFRGTGPYFSGETFNLTISFSNTGNYSATNLDGHLTFSNGNLIANDPLPISLPSGSMGTQTFTITVADLATTGPVTITATWMSDGNGYGDFPADTSTIYTQTRSAVSISELVITGTNAVSPYIAGMSFNITVTYTNTGGTAANDIDATIDDGTCTSLSWTNPAAVTVAAVGTNTQTFTATVAAGATTELVTIAAAWTGTEAITNRTLSGDVVTDAINLDIQTCAAVSITNAVVSGSKGAGPYAAGMNFTVVVTFSNAGGAAATVGATIDATPSTFLHGAPISPVSIVGSSFAIQTFTFSIEPGTTAAMVNMSITWSGTETATGREISGDPTPAIIPGGIRIGEIPLARFNASALEAYVSQPVFLVDESVDPDGNIVDWDWSFGDGTSAVGQNVSHGFTSPGSYWIKLTITDDDGFTAEKVLLIVVRTQSTPWYDSISRQELFVIAIATSIALVACGLTIQIRYAQSRKDRIKAEREFD